MLPEPQIVLTPLDLTKEAAVHELEQHLKTTWAEYGVKESSLLEEMQTWYWKHTPVGRNKYHDVLMWRGIGVTLAEAVEKRKVAILAAQDALGVALALDKAKKLAFASA